MPSTDHMTATRPLLDFDLLRTFVAVVEARSFTDAANRVGRTQSTVSSQVRRLEDSLGATLVVRGKRSITPTNEGTKLLDYAKDLLELESRAVASVRRPLISGSVRLGTQDDFATRRLPALLSQFARRYPEVEVGTFCGLGIHLMRQLEKGDLDLVLTRQPKGPKSGQMLWTEKAVWVGLPETRVKPNGPIPVVAFPEGCFYRRIMSETLATHGRSFAVAYTSSSSASVQAAVRAGLGVSVLARGTVLPDVFMLGEDYGLPKLPDLTIGLHRSSKLRSKAAERLADFITTSLAPCDI